MGPDLAAKASQGYKGDFEIVQQLQQIAEPWAPRWRAICGNVEMVSGSWPRAKVERERRGERFPRLQGRASGAPGKSTYAQHVLARAACLRQTREEDTLRDRRLAKAAQQAAGAMPPRKRARQT